MQRPAWFGGTRSFLNRIAHRARPKRRSPGHVMRAGGANLRFEPLEHRNLLSVGPVGDGQDQLAAYVDPPESTEVYAALETTEATVDTTEVSRHPVRVRFAVRTEEPIEDVESFINELELPDELGYIHPTTVDVQVVLPGWLSGEAGYKTIIDAAVVTALDEEMIIAELNELDCFEYVRLEAGCVVNFGPNAQESIDNLTKGGSSTERIIHANGTEVVPTRVRPIEVDVAVETPYRMTDLARYVESQEWPDELGPIGAHNVEQLVTIPMNFADRNGGHKTYFRIKLRGDISALDRVDFLTFARLTSESLVKFGPHAQESIDRITVGHSPGRISACVGAVPTHASPMPMLAQSGDMINMDSFRADSRFDGIDGSGHAIAVLDTGIDRDHSHFGTATGGVSDRLVYDWDFVNNDSDASDDYGHGTHVTGIAASEDSTYTGMAPGADIVALKVLDDEGDGVPSDIEDALGWLVNNAATYNVVAINMSLGDYGKYTTDMTLYDWDDELDTLVNDMGIIVVSASGNDYWVGSGPEVQGIQYPSADPNSLSVGAVFDADVGPFPEYPLPPTGPTATTTAADQITPFSQRDDQLTTVMAPGAWITSAWPGGGTWTDAGTSMAAPHIAGIAVLAQQLAMQELGQHLTQNQFADLLQSTGTTVTDNYGTADNVYNTGLGFKRVDMFDLAEGILDLRIEVDADDDPAPGSQKDDGTADTFEVTRSGSNILVKVNGSTVYNLPYDSAVKVVVNGSGDDDTVYVQRLSGYFGNIEVNAGADGSGDVAHVYDDFGDDTLEASPGDVKFQTEDAYSVQVNDFYRVNVYSTNGGTDSADLTDSAGNDKFVSIPASNHNGLQAYIRDVAQTNFYNQLYQFEEVVAHASNGGTDIAYLHGDADLDDQWNGWCEGTIPGGYLTSDTTLKLLKSQIDNFDTVTVTAWGGASDYDDVYRQWDSTGDDTFTFNPTSVTLTPPTGYPTFEFKSFDKVGAYATKGGDDTATFNGASGNVKDEFTGFYMAVETGATGQPTASIMTGTSSGGSPADTYDYYAKYFENVVANPVWVSGDDVVGTDIAKFYDSPGDDTFTCHTTYAEQEYEDGGVQRANDFYGGHHAYGTYNAYGSDGGVDTAYFYGGSGTDIFVSEPTASVEGSGKPNVATMLKSGDYWNRAKYFEEAFADFGTDPGTGDDLAKFYDSPAADELVLNLDFAEFWNGPSSGSFDYHHKAEGLGTSADDVELHTDTSHGTTDTISEGLHSYTFTEIEF